MKLFSKLGSCWGSAKISTAAEEAVSGQQTDEQGVYSYPHGHRTSRSLVKVRTAGGGTTLWMPDLNAISEDRPMPEMGRGGLNRRVDNKKPAKVKPRWPARAAPPLEDNWKSSHAMALPTFFPTSFLF